MNLYLLVKLVHIVSSTILFGTGLGTAFFMFRAYRSSNRQALAACIDTVVLADWIFTTPAVVVQLASGLWLSLQLGIAFNSVWFVSVISLFILVGCCWIPVVWIQIRIRNGIRNKQPEENYLPLMRVWIALGIPAFLSVLALFVLMVMKPGMQHLLFV